MNSWQFLCKMPLVNWRPPTTKTRLSYCFSFSTSAMKSLSPPTITKVLMWSRVKAISRASSARLMSAPFLSPRGVTLRCTMWMACCVISRLYSLARGQSAYATLLTTSPRSLSASSTMETSKSFPSVSLTPIWMLSKSMNTAIFSLSSATNLLFHLGRGLGLRHAFIPQEVTSPLIILLPVGTWHLHYLLTRWRRSSNAGLRCTVYLANRLLHSELLAYREGVGRFREAMPAHDCPGRQFLSLPIPLCVWLW